MRRGGFDGAELVPGVNVDALDIPRGMAELTACGYTDPRTVMVVDYALRRWARGEEEQAERGAIDSSFHGIDFTSWRRVLASAMAGAAGTHPNHPGHPATTREGT